LRGLHREGIVQLPDERREKAAIQEWHTVCPVREIPGNLLVWMLSKVYPAGYDVGQA
jgi:hypothetical protein